MPTNALCGGVDGISERPASSSGAVVAVDKAEPHDKDERTWVEGQARRHLTVSNPTR